MIKRYYNITLRDYNLMETTGRINQFSTTILPAWIFKRKLNKELSEISKILNAKESEDEEKEKVIWELRSLAKINAIEINYLGIVNILGLATRVTIYKSFLRRNNKRKIKFNDNSLKYFKDKIREYTGIEIKTISDVEKVRKELEFRKDKFDENFRKQRNSKKLYLMSVALGVFSYLNQTLDMDMKIVEFAIMRDSALEKMSKDKSK